MEIVNMQKKKKNILILTSSGGAGCIQIAVAKKQKLLQKDPSANVIIVDIMKKWAWFGLGRFFVFLYNTMQILGKVDLQNKLTSCQRVAEFILWFPIFLSSLLTFFRKDIDRVFDTQPLCSSAFIKAIRIYNQKKNKAIFLEKILTDLPTRKSTHFFNNIKKLSLKDREYIRILTIDPLLDTSTEELFWQKHCNLKLSQIQKENFCVRESFYKYFSQQKTDKNMEIFIRIKEERKHFLAEIFSKAKGEIKPTKEGFSFVIAPQDKVIVILLGSQAAQKATLSYVENFFFCMKKIDQPVRKYYFFVFCPNNKKNIFQKVYEFLMQEEKIPSHCSIIPISFQKEDVIASLFFRSDISITRSGGQTAMELMTASKGKIWIHSETKDFHNMDSNTLLKGIPGWEAGNAEYLKEKYSASIVTPQMIFSLTDEFI